MGGAVTMGGTVSPGGSARVEPEGVLRGPDVEAAVRTVRAMFERDGWSLELLGTQDRFLLMRRGCGRCGGALPWALRHLEHELMARLPEMRGVILA